MQINQHIYSFSYDNTESELCKLESKFLFKQQEKNRVLLSDIKVEPCNSAFVKKRLDIVLSSEDYETLIQKIKEKNINIEGFKAEYLVLNGDNTEYDVRLSKLKDVGYSIEGTPDYYKPTITYGLTYYEGIWYFGVLIKDDFAWHKHKKKPVSYSNSIGISVAKSMVNIAANSNKESKLLDVCCGVGTIMLEACFAGIKIDGCDINWKICNDARENLAHFNYSAEVYHSDVKEISLGYDAGIVDLPYNLYSSATDDEIVHIMESASKITNRLVIASISDISNLINDIGFTITDHCSVGKSGKRKFTRQIWVCEKVG